MYRSLLYVPAHAERFIGKAHERGADAIILDLEDAVPEADKDAARAGLGRSVERVGQAGAAVLVRINAGARALDDAKAALAAKAVAIVVAKAEPAGLADLASVGMPLIAMLESPAAILDARACAAHPGVIGLMVGGEDLATELGAQPTPEVLRVPKLLAHYAAKAEGKLSFGMLRSTAEKRRLAPLAVIVAHATHAQEPGLFTTAPVGAIEKLYKKTGWTTKDVDLFEINEAFAAVPMAAMNELDIPHGKVNIHGGACALGHPIGASGARIIVTLLGALKKTGGRRGVASLCIGGGEATAMAIEMV